MAGRNEYVASSVQYPSALSLHAQQHRSERPMSLITTHPKSVENLRRWTGYPIDQRQHADDALIPSTDMFDGHPCPSSLALLCEETPIEWMNERMRRQPCGTSGHATCASSETETALQPCRPQGTAITGTATYHDAAVISPLLAHHGAYWTPRCSCSPRNEAAHSRKPFTARSTDFQATDFRLTPG